jgi:hypothetical protein
MASSGTYLLRHKDRSSPAILVPHPYGDTLKRPQGLIPRVAGFVYTAIDVADGGVSPKPEDVACFAKDLPEQLQRVVWANARCTGSGPMAQISFIPRK